MAFLAAAFVGLTIAGVTAGAIALLVLRSRRPAPPDLPHPPGAQALQEIETLKGSSNEVVKGLQATLSRYLHRAYGVPALFRTPEELVGGTKEGAPPPLPGVRPFIPLFDRLAAQRFSSPSNKEGETRILLEEARRLLLEDCEPPELTSPEPLV